MVFSALDPLADPAVHEIPRRSGDGQGVNHRDQDKRQLDVDIELILFSILYNG